VTASIVVRTYNEARYLGELLDAIETQQGIDREVIIVDSGSNDDTLEIATRHHCRIEHITRAEFSFGRSLNLGCAAAQGDHLVFTSGHCVPDDRNWLRELCAPLGKRDVVYSYGRQIGGGESKFSEQQLFRKYFPNESKIPQDGYFCNNANAALMRSVWAEYPFDEELTGLEDMHLAKRLVARGFRLAYVASATVKHYHHESWAQVRRRYEREAIALQHIMPEVHLEFGDFLRYYTSAVMLDAGTALSDGKLVDKSREILVFRFMQFWGAYRGNREHRKLSRTRKEHYFYPKGNLP
jgi:glycosyltransferase involved in cell wall biosynthesis